MPGRGQRRTTFTFVERSVPDRERVEQGLKVLGQLIAMAYAQDGVLAGVKGYRDTTWISPQEESIDAAEQRR